MRNSARSIPSISNEITCEMLIERPPKFFRLLFPGCLFRRRIPGEKCVYLTFDDGPVPGVTPGVLDILDRYCAKATFFMVGDNVRKYPGLYKKVVARGHQVGNHTMHHLQGIRCHTDRYLRDVAEAETHISSTLFRPPHGLLRRRQICGLRNRYRMVMYDLITRDYSRRLTAEDVVENVKRYTRDGSIIVFHDSEKSQPRVLDALPRALQWLQDQGYKFRLIDYKA